MSNIDEVMRFDKDTICQRCGFDKAYHKMIVDGKIHIKCIRKKPYKLADGVDVKLGMQVWTFHKYHDNCKIRTGMVRFIGSWGCLTLWKYAEDRDPDRIFDLSHHGFPYAIDCYSSFEKAQFDAEKEKKRQEYLHRFI